MKLGHINTILNKELRGYFNSPLAYLFIVGFLVCSSWLFFQSFFLDNVASLRPFFAFLPWPFLILLPAVTMRLWAEEQKLGTLETLLSAPVTEGEAVLGKFFASFSFLAIALLLSALLPLLVWWMGSPDWGMVMTGYLGALLLGAAILAIGLWVSSLTSNQIVSFVCSVLIVFFLYLIGHPLVLQTAPAAMLPWLKGFGMGSHYASILRGVIDTRDLFYYFTLIVLFLYFNVTSLNSRKWH